MARYIGPKNKKARRAGINLELTRSHTKLQRRLSIPPGQHGRKGRGKLSEFGEQLAEKQKLKWMFGVMERQLRRYYEQAAKTRKATGTVLLQLLERRLDNALFRLGLAPTRAAARQLTSHGHVRVNGQKVTAASYQLRPEETLTLSPKALNFPQVKELLAQKDLAVPKWLKRQAAVGKVTRLPEREDMPVEINEQLIVEFYSR